jgi:hypothetical protein
LGARAVAADGVVAFVGPGVGGGAGLVVESATVVVGADAAVVFTLMSCCADQIAAARTPTTAQSRTIRRTSTASVCPVLRR